jgi:hypothetical protein
MIKKAWVIAFSALLFTSCSSLHKVAINSASGLLYNASGAVESESNLEMIRLSLPGNLTLIEGLLHESKENDDILATLTKGYVGYAFSINESDLMIDEYENKKTDFSKVQALRNYSKALSFGVRYLKEKNIDWNELITNANENSLIMHQLDRRLSDDQKDLETVMFTAQALGAMINLQKDNMGLVAQLPIVKILFDWVCMKNPSINFGTCDIFNGTYEAGRPKMLGGNPEKAKEIFEKAILKHPHNWLIRSSYIQYYLIPQSDEVGFKIQMDALKDLSEKFNKYQIYNVEKVNSEWAREERIRFYQAIGINRYEIFEKYKKQLF